MRRLATLLAAAVIVALAAPVAPARGDGCHQEEDHGDCHEHESEDGKPQWHTRRPVRSAPAFKRVLGETVSPWDAVSVNHHTPLACRGIAVTRTSIMLLVGGEVRKVIPLRGRSYRSIRFETITRLVNDRSWIRNAGRGVFELKAALGQYPRTHVLIMSPGVRELRLMARPCVALLGQGPGASILIDQVTVTSWTAKGGPDMRLRDGRPFIRYEKARLMIRQSTMRYLGANLYGGQYGTSWFRGATGYALDSVFERSMFGAFSNDAHHVTFRRDVFRDNISYGLDPHTGSRHLTVADNEAYGNGKHGIIFSKGVTDSLVSGNYTHDNAGSGIVMHADSDRNVIERNIVVHNKHDGIALLSAGHNIVRLNDVRDNGLDGIRLAHPGPPGNVIERNTISGNRIGIEVYGGPGVRIVENTIDRPAIAGMVLRRAVMLNGGVIRDAPRGLDVRVSITVRAMFIVGGSQAVVVSQRARVTLESVYIDGVSTGIATRPGAEVIIRQGVINARDIGVVVRDGAAVSLAGAMIHSGRIGIKIARRGHARAHGSHIDGIHAVVGYLSGTGNALANRPGSWLPYAGMIAIAAAISFELLVGIAPILLRIRRRVLSLPTGLGRPDGGVLPYGAPGSGEPPDEETIDLEYLPPRVNFSWRLGSRSLGSVSRVGRSQRQGQ